MDFKTYDEMSALIAQNGNVITCHMASLRDAHGAGKLGITVTNNISSALAHRGVAHNPPMLPQQQWEKVRLYKLGTTVADLIAAANEVGEDKDEMIRQLANSTANEDLKKIREIVCP